MSTLTSNHADRELQAAVHDELSWTPQVEAARIGVAVEDSIVTLSGEVEDYSELIAAIYAATHVAGVSTVVDDLRLPPITGTTITEAEVAREVAHALQWAVNVPQSVKAEIRGHDVILSGQVEWHFQRSAAKNAVKHLEGVNYVDNRVGLSARASSADAEGRIRDALIRHAHIDTDRITVTIRGGKATLTGQVDSLVEKDQADDATWSSPHVTEVQNLLAVKTR